MKRATQKDEIPFHRFAWDRLSFKIPQDWNLSYYHFHRKTSTVRMEDDDLVRLEIEWVVRSRSIEMDEVMQRYHKRATELEEQAERCVILEDLAKGWTGFQYDMSEGRTLVTLMWLGADRRLFAFLRMHFRKNERELRKAVVATVTDSFQLHPGARVPWEVYDMAVEVDGSFTLINTAFNAGRKMLVFQRRLTRLYIWQFSLADHLLKNKTMAQWAAEFLGNFKTIRAVRFVADTNDRVKTVRRRRHLLGHYDELGRGCFRYHVGIKRLEARNAILLWVYSFRSNRDLLTLGNLATAA